MYLFFSLSLMYLMERVLPHVSAGQRLIKGEHHRVVFSIWLMAPLSDPALIICQRAVETSGREERGNERTGSLKVTITLLEVDYNSVSLWPLLKCQLGGFESLCMLIYLMSYPYMSLSGRPWMIQWASSLPQPPPSIIPETEGAQTRQKCCEFFF